jgi:N-acetylglucosamine-6-sulfatase
MDGKSFLSLAGNKPVPWRDFLLYEYYWEWPFPQTPTMFALRGDQFKYIHYYGLWDSNELYDLKADPLESRNLIYSAQHQDLVKQLREQLFTILSKTDGMYIPLYPARFGQQNLRRKNGSKAAEFPPPLIKKPED